MMEVYYEHRYVLEKEEMSEGERKIFKRMLAAEANDVDIMNSLKILSKILYQYHKKPVMLLIDEYDVPLQNAYIQNYYDEAVTFYRTFYGTTFKDNPYLEKTVITGVSRIAKESIFSRSKQFQSIYGLR